MGVSPPKWSAPWSPVLPALSEEMRVVGEVSFHTSREEI